MPELNLAAARHNMIEQQIRTWAVLDPRVLEVFSRLPRDAFVAPPHRALAYADLQLPLPHGQAMLAPKVEGRILQALDLAPQERVLEVGTGSGFLTACLASLARHVLSIDLFEDFTASAHDRLVAHGIHNVSLITADAAHGWTEGGPYDAIVLGGSLPVWNPRWLEALAPGGRLFAVIGRAPAMQAMLWTCTDTGDNTGDNIGDNRGGSVREVLFETVLAPLLNACATETFRL